MDLQFACNTNNQSIGIYVHLLIHKHKQPEGCIAIQSTSLM